MGLPCIPIDRNPSLKPPSTLVSADQLHKILQLPGVLKDVGFSDCDARIAMALVVAHMIHPSSERGALRWLETNSATLELLRLDTRKGLKLDKLHHLSDLLVKHHRAIDRAFPR